MGTAISLEKPNASVLYPVYPSDQSGIGRMRHWYSLKRQMQKAKIVPSIWSEHELSLFLEVEALLHLVETLRSDLNAQEAWMLVSGYVVEGLNDTPDQRRMCLQLRIHLRYVKTASAWRSWFTWYREQPLQARLYTSSQDKRLERVGGCVLMEDRLEAYEALLIGQEQTSIVASHEEYASAGQEYTFIVDGVAQKLMIPAEFQQFAGLQTSGRIVPSRTRREALIVNLHTLLQTAAEIDALEFEVGIAKRGHWKKRLERLIFSQRTAIETFQPSQTITLEGLYHLAGALGVGKSTIIWVLTYHLARYESKHITVVMNTVVETISFAVWLRQLGVQAAPALGRNRADHALKYGLANQASLSIERVFDPETPPDPVLNWFPTPCVLSGMLPTPIPVGQEPCYRLEDAEGNHHDCPLMSVCPVHKVGRDLAESQVWVLNPMSFLYSSAPKSIGNGQLSLFEAVYRISDLVIIDEADRIQVQWDRAFAPAQPIAGSYDALLDTLRRKIAVITTGQRRRISRTTAFNRLSKMDNQADIVVNRAFLLLGRSRKLRTWLMRRQVTNARLFYLLIEDLLKNLPARTSDEEKQHIKEQLEEVFKRFWQQPMRDQGSDLALWVKNLLGSDARDHELQRILERWLAAQMQWKLPLRDKRRHVARRLELAVVLAAMMKQTNDIFHQLKGIEDQIGSLDTGTVELREALVALVPDSPIGEMLGLRFLDADASNRTGVFTATRHRG